MIITDPLMMYQFCEKDVRKLIALPFRDLVNMKPEAKLYFMYLQDILDIYNCNNLSAAMNVVIKRRQDRDFVLQIDNQGEIVRLYFGLYNLYVYLYLYLYLIYKPYHFICIYDYVCR